MLPRQYLSQGLDLAAVVAVAHVVLAHPLCPNLSCVLARAVGEAQLDGSIHLQRGGTCACIEGPQFSTLADSRWYPSLGASVNG